MGFLKNFFTNVLHEGAPSLMGNSFDHASEVELENHLGVKRYGSFILTDAVRPSYDLKIIPSQGYRHDTYLDQESRSNVPVLMGSASKEKLFECFMELITPLGSVVDVVLETSHSRENVGHSDLYREHIDMPVLESILWDFEDMLINDGCTGIAVLNPNIPQEVQFDEHKLLIVYGSDLMSYERVFEQSNVHCRDEMKFITEAEHVHSSSDQYSDQFDQLKVRLGIDAMFG